MGRKKRKRGGRKGRGEEEKEEGKKKRKRGGRRGK